MNDKLDEYSRKLMESIYLGTQHASLKWAAEIRRLVLKEKMAAVKSKTGVISDPELAADYLGELEKLASILGPDKDL